MTSRVILIAPLVLLAACGDDVPAETEEDAQREAAGEVLGGTISDDMLPLDDLRSQSPPLRESAEGGENEDGGESTAPAEDAQDTAGENPAEQNPAQEDPAMTPDPAPDA